MSLVNAVVNSVFSNVHSSLKTHYPDSYEQKFIEFRLTGVEDKIRRVFKDIECGGFSEFKSGAMSSSLSDIFSALLGGLGALNEAISSFYIAADCPQDDRKGGVFFNADLSPVIVASEALASLLDETLITNWHPFKNYPFVTTQADMQFNYSKSDRLEGWFENRHQSGNFDKQDILGNHLHSMVGSFVRLINNSAHHAIKKQNVLDVGDDNLKTVLGNQLSKVVKDYSSFVGGATSYLFNSTLNKTVKGVTTLLHEANFSKTVKGATTLAYNNSYNKSIDGSTSLSYKSDFSKTIHGSATVSYKSGLSSSVNGSHSLEISNENLMKALKHILEGDVTIKGDLKVEGTIS